MTRPKPMNPQRMMCLLLASIALACGHAPAKVMTVKPIRFPDTAPVIPRKGQGILVAAICGRGCLGGGKGPRVYLLGESDYARYRNNLAKPSGAGGKNVVRVDSKGKPPLLMEDLSPGVYYVGVEVLLDDRIVRPRPRNYVAGAHRLPSVPQAVRRFFISDMASGRTYGWSIVEGSLAPKLTQWYRIELRPQVVEPVVALFLPRDALPGDWAKHYPKTDQFSPAPGERERLRSKIWTVLESAGAKTSAPQRAQLTRLLLRGGRVAIPLKSEACALWLDGGGKIQCQGTAVLAKTLKSLGQASPRPKSGPASRPGAKPPAASDPARGRREVNLIGKIQSRHILSGPGRPFMAVPHLVTSDKAYELRTSLKDTRWVNVQKLGGQYIFYHSRCLHRVKGRLDERNDKVIWATLIEDIDKHAKAKTRPAGPAK